MSSTHLPTGAETALKYADKIHGKTILITGPSTNSIGAAAALSLAAQSPALIILASRAISKVQPVLDAINASGKARAIFLPLDLTSQDSIRRAVASLPAELKIDILINSAGVMAIAQYEEVEAAGGREIEMQYATNHVGHFLLTNLLLRTHPITRVVNVTSQGHYFGPWSPPTPATYNPWKAYGNSKTANILFSLALAARGVEAIAPHPGTPATNLMDHITDPNVLGVYELLEEMKVEGRGFPRDGDEKTVDQAGATLVDAAFGGWGKGEFTRNMEAREDARAEWAKDPEVAERLWRESEELVGEKFEIGNRV